MAKIKEWNKCENCVHNNVCEFRAGREECVEQMNSELDNLGYTTDFLYFLLNVKNLSRENLLRKICLKDVSHNCRQWLSFLSLIFYKIYDIIIIYDKEKGESRCLGSKYIVTLIIVI